MGVYGKGRRRVVGRRTAAQRAKKEKLARRRQTARDDRENLGNAFTKLRVGSHRGLTRKRTSRK